MDILKLLTEQAKKADEAKAVKLERQRGNYLAGIEARSRRLREKKAIAAKQHLAKVRKTKIAVTCDCTENEGCPICEAD